MTALPAIMLIESLLMTALKFMKNHYNRPMIKVSCTLFILSIFMPCMVSASSQTFPPPVEAALELWKLIAPDENRDIFDDLKLNPVVGHNAPLARYHSENGGMVEIGQNLRQYRRDYIHLSSPMDISTKPDFDQYLAVMIMLSLSNEAAHILQDKNGSLKDFYKFYKSGELSKACALYALQQHVSDIMMLKSAIRAEQLFLGRGSIKGINALRLALQKNNLSDEFELFREAMKNRNMSDLNFSLSAIRSKRGKDNMAGLNFCSFSGTAQLDKKIINRATAPVGIPFTNIPSNPPKNILTYNP